MAYCTRMEVREMLKEEALEGIIGNVVIDSPAERDALIDPLIDVAIADADGEMDGYLAKRYPVPLNPAPKVICKFSKDIAIYNLLSRTGIDEASSEKNYLNRYHAAIKFLTLIAEGKVSLGADAEEAGKASNSGFAAHSNSRLFNRDKMRGM